MKKTTPQAVKLLMDGSEALSRVEANGVRVNTEYLDATIEKTKKTITGLEADLKNDEVYRQWRKHYGLRLKMRSRTQLAHILYKVMGHPPALSAETGKPTADADALAEIDLPFCQNYVRIENLKKTLSTYLLGIKRELVKDGCFWYVHPIYNLHTAVTYRSSCDHPNFQNVPKRNKEMMELIRPCYMPHPGHHMAEFDFSGIEVKVAACYTKDPNLIKYILDPTTDMHRDTAKEIFFITQKEYDQFKDYYKKTVRDGAKNMFVFPEFYGSVFFNCATNIWKGMKKRDFRFGGPEGVSMFQHLSKNGVKELGEKVSDYSTGRIATKTGTFMEHCRKVEELFWNKRFKVYTQWKRSYYEQYKKEGGFSSLTGFRVNGHFGKNEVLNAPIQGSAFHCLLWSLIMMDRWLIKYRMKSKIIGEIHDSLVMSLHPAELQDVMDAGHHIMTVLMPKHFSWINVPIEAELEVGDVDGHWVTCKEWKRQNGLWSLAT